MQSAHQGYTQAIPPSGTQMQEMFELSFWLEDVFNTNAPPVHEPSVTDFEIKPEMLLSSPFDGMDHEVDIINSSPTISLDCMDVVHPVSPTPSPIAPAKTVSSLPATTDAFQMQLQAPVSILSTKRKHVSDSTHVVSDSSDNEDTSQRSPKRQRKAQHTAKPVKPVSAPIKPAIKPKTKPAVAPKKPRIADPATKKQIRREKNREHAKKSRSKKRDYNNALEESVMALREENKKLRELVYGRFGETKAKAMVAERIQTPEDKMIEALKKPANKVLSQSVIHYLESLRHDIKLNPTR